MPQNSLRRPKKPKFSTLDCLKCVTDLTDGSKLKKERHKRWLEKQYKANKGLKVIEDPNWRKNASPEAVKEVNSRDWLFRLANALLYMGDYSWWGWEFRSQWGLMCATNPEALKMRLWNGKSEKVLLLGEQGLGDEIMFSSCIPDLLDFGTEVTYMCDERLIPVMERSFPIKCIPRVLRKELKTVHEIRGEYDSYFPLGELPRLFRQGEDEFPGTPFLKPAEREFPELAGAVGVSWRGRNGYYSRDEFPQGISLQYDTRWDEGEPCPIDAVNDLDGLISLISQLDKVICVSTTVAHIAGAVGTPVDVILAPQLTRHPENMINWRWRGGNINYSPWYGSAKVYRSLKQWRGK
jgi:hypothetical protein